MDTDNRTSLFYFGGRGQHGTTAPRIRTEGHGQRDVTFLFRRLRTARNDGAADMHGGTRTTGRHLFTSEAADSTERRPADTHGGTPTNIGDVRAKTRGPSRNDEQLRS